MKLLLDTHVVIAVLGDGRDGRRSARLAEVDRADHTRLVSVASLWEIAIKSRLGKLDVGHALDTLPALLEVGGFVILPVTAAHALADLAMPPATRDPFDRLLLAQAQIEGARLVTWDRALVAHPLAARPQDPQEPA